MNIRIKELFKSDLDPNSTEWWSEDKIDKINYNFNVLSEGGPAGPVGIEGPNGNEGLKGGDGDEGSQGPQGPQGVPGPDSSGNWILENIPVAGTFQTTQNQGPTLTGRDILYPAVDESLILQYSQQVLPTLVIGTSAYQQDPPNDNTFLSTFYDANAPTNSSHQSTSSATLTVVTESATNTGQYNTHSELDSIRFANKPIPAGINSLDDHWAGRTFVISLDKNATVAPGVEETNLYIGVSEGRPTDGVNISNNQPSILADWPDFHLNHLATATSFEARNLSGPNVNVILSETSEIEQGIKVIHDGEWGTDDDGNPIPTGESCTFTVGKIKYNVNANVNNVLISQDDLGEVQWNSVANIFNAMPIGSITKIPTDKFETYFRTTTSITNYEGEGNGFPLFTSNFGSGLGMYQGWYLCNGQTWGDGGGISFEVPAISTFEYVVNDIGPSTPNTATNGLLSIGDGILLGGLRGSRVEVDPNDSDQLISSDDLTVDPVLHLDYSGGINNTVEKRKMGDQFTIIRLGNPDLKWGNFDSNVSLEDLSAKFHALENSYDHNGRDIAARYASTLANEDLQWTGSQDPNYSGTYQQLWSMSSTNESHLAGARFYKNGTELQSGWIVISDLAREYINGQGITSQKFIAVNSEEAYVYGEAFQDTSGSTNTVFGLTGGGSIQTGDVDTAVSTGQTPEGVLCGRWFANHKMQNHPNSTSNGGQESWSEWESTVTHIWQVDTSNNSILKPSEGWYRPVVESAGFEYQSVMYGPEWYATYRRYWSGATANQFEGETIKSIGAYWSIDDFTLASGQGSVSTVCAASNTHVCHFMETIYPITTAEKLNQFPYDNEIDNITQTFPPSQNQSLAKVLYVPANQSPIANTQSSDNRGKYPFIKVLADTQIPMNGTYPVIGDASNASYPSYGSHYFEINSDSKANTIEGYQQCQGNNFSPINEDFFTIESSEFLDISDESILDNFNNWSFLPTNLATSTWWPNPADATILSPTAACAPGTSDYANGNRFRAFFGCYLKPIPSGGTYAYSSLQDVTVAEWTVKPLLGACFGPANHVSSLADPQGVAFMNTDHSNTATINGYFEQTGGTFTYSTSSTSGSFVIGTTSHNSAIFFNQLWKSTSTTTVNVNGSVNTYDVYVEFDSKGSGWPAPSTPNGWSASLSPSTNGHVNHCQRVHFIKQ